MSYRWRSSMYRSAGFLIVIILFAAMPSGWSQTAARSASQIPRMPDGKPNFTGLWQSLGTAYWDIEDHSAHAGAFFQLGATGAEPAGQGIVEGGEIPYTTAAAAKKAENLKNRMKLDPEIKCYMPGIPRANYMAFPFQIIQSQRDIAFAYEYATANRVVNMGKFAEGAVDTWMGTSNGHWDGATLVVDVSGLNGSSWFDRSGNFETENTHVVERFTLADADHINYEATIDDKTIYTRPWKISTVFYRRKEKNAQLNEFKCVEYVEELIYGDLKKK
ncbi:MAG TPA: hypothetical protein VIY49_27440 [Bryobacteraceae bacterium]